MSAWSLYDELIDAMPSGITVHDYCLGAHWTYIVADCGMGIAKTVRGGGKGRFKQSPVDVDLKTLAALAKSWNWLEASLGVAAINAYYATPDTIESLGGTIDEDVAESGDVSNPFHRLKGRYTGRKVAVVGHFPNVDEMRKVAQVTVLERNYTSPTDTPDPACEYILPEQDYVFVTGTTLTNKTMPRLLELSRVEAVRSGPERRARTSFLRTRRERFSWERCRRREGGSSGRQRRQQSAMARGN